MADANPARCDRSAARTARSGRPASGARRSTHARPTPTGPSTRSRRSAGRGATLPAARRTTTASVRTVGSETLIPATVWAPGPDPIDASAVWPTPLIEQIANAFSTPGDTVVLLPWPSPSTLAGAVSDEGLVGAGGVIDHAPGELGSIGLSAALDTLAGLDRAAHVVHLDPRTLARASASRPFWADLIDHNVDHSVDRSVERGVDRDIDSATGPLRTRSATRYASSTHGEKRPRLDAAAGSNGGLRANGTSEEAHAPGTADVVITSLPMNPDETADLTADAEALAVAGRDLIAPAAARLLRAGGILVVLTHSDWSRGWLLDPTGPVVAAAQNADLLYLQHIVALHTPIRDGELLAPTDDDTAAAQYARTAHRAQVRGLPAPHRRAASDLLVFAQPADHQRAPQPPATAAREGGVIR